MIVWLSQVASAACLLLGPATVHTPSAVREAHEVLVQDGRIMAVRPATTGPAPGCTRVDARGGHITAGLVEVNSQFGLVEIGLETATHDDDGGGDAVRAALRPLEGYNPASVLIPVARTGGLTTALTLPAGGRISGPAALVHLAGNTVEEATLVPAAAMVANLGGASSAEAFLELREILAAAREFKARPRPALDQDRSTPYGAGAADLVALQPVLDGRLPLLIGADREADLRALMAFATEQRVRVVVLGGAEAWTVADLLAAAKIPVVVDPLLYGPGGFDQTRARPDNAAILAKAGVPVLFSTFNTHQARTLAQVAGNAVRGGMDAEAALAAITRTPAAVFGAPDRGRVEAGAKADLVVWDGPPLALASYPRRIYVDGVEASLRTRQTELLERYRSLPGTPSAPLPLPGRH